MGDIYLKRLIDAYIPVYKLYRDELSCLHDSLDLFKILCAKLNDFATSLLTSSYIEPRIIQEILKRYPSEAKAQSDMKLPSNAISSPDTQPIAANGDTTATGQRPDCTQQ